MKKIKRLDQRGFTLLEMLIVIFIIGLLILLVIPNINSQRETAEEKANEALKTTVETQIQLYAIEYGDVPENIDQLEGYLSTDQLNQAKSLFNYVDGQLTPISE